MKKLLLVFLIFVLNNSINSQVVFCPPGAEWHYSFAPRIGLQSNEEIKYATDSVLNGETVKVIKHTRFYVSNNYPITNNCILSLLKQRGDTIYVKNSGTQDKWQILYNFAALPGQKWHDSICEVDPAANLGPQYAFSYTVVVDSVKNVIINNFQLKRLFVRYTSSANVPYLQDTLQITERIGCSRFMFNYYPIFHDETETGPDTFGDFLCYKDDMFGLKQFTDHSCDYSNVGIEKNAEFKNGINVYPNPSNDKILFDIPLQDNIDVTVYSTFGSEVLKIKSYSNLSALDVSGLIDGVYFYKIRTKTNNYFGKFVKE